MKPSKRQIEEHELTHLPFREWCVHCQKGKSQNNPHRNKESEFVEEEEKENAATTISIDYGYFNENFNRMTAEEYDSAVARGDKNNRPMIVVEDRKTSAITAHLL